MADALDAVLQMRREKLLRSQQEAEALEKGIQGGIDNFIKARTLQQQQKKLQLEDLLTRSKIAELPQDRLIKSGQAADALLKQLEAGVINKSQFDSQISTLSQAQAQTNLNKFLSSPKALGTATETSGTTPAIKDDLFATETNVAGVPTKLKSESGIRREQQIEAEKEFAKGIAEKSTKISSALQTSDRNLVTIGSAGSELARVYADGIEEGGLGTLHGAFLSQQIGRRAGGEFGDKFPASLSFTGKKVEFLARMMPLLTQQGDKEGSVRLVESVFRKLGETLPDEQTGPIAGANEIMETVRNAVRFASAIRQEDIKIPSNEEVEKMTDPQLNSLKERIEAAAAKIQLSEEEESAIDNLIAEVLKPMAKVLRFETEEEVERSRLPKGTRITFRGQLAEVT